MVRFNNRRQKIKKLKIVLIYIVATIGLCMSVSPYLYLIIQSFTPEAEVDRVLVPSHLTLESYRWLFLGAGAKRPWLRALFNSIIVAGSSTVIALLGGAMVGYALSRLQFKGRDLFNNFLLFHMFYPGIILLVPLFLLVVFLGFYNSYLGMILPKALSLWAIFLYSSFFLSIPKEIIEAARLDKASELQIIFQIMIPLSWPITTVVGLLVFLRRWSELLWDMVVITSYDKMTLNVLLATMSTGEYVDFPGPMYAATFILTFPVVILFLIFGKRFTKGISLTIK